MNTIIVPTDFSSAAANAITYAAGLAQQINASVLLLHVYQLPVPMTEYPVLMVTHDDLKKATDDGLQKAVDEARKAHAGVQFEAESRLGDIATEVEEVCRERKPFALIVGTKDLSGFERFLFGDTTASLVRNSSFPVIAVPEGTRADRPKNIVLASDLLHIDEMPTEKITAMAKELNACLHVVHVESRHDDEVGSPDTLLQKLSGVDASFHAVKEDDVSEGLKHYVEQNNIDLVLVLPHKHNLYERLFFKGHTQGILHAVPVPVMCLKNE
jgi:nucleotide-binding universal stress UspA family protein